MTYKPAEVLEVRYLYEPTLAEDGACDLAGAPGGQFAMCRGGGRGYVYELPGGRWAHVRCYHRRYGFPDENHATQAKVRQRAAS